MSRPMQNLFSFGMFTYNLRAQIASQRKRVEISCIYVVREWSVSADIYLKNAARYQK